jgi:hypothetical protein
MVPLSGQHFVDVGVRADRRSVENTPGESTRSEVADPQEHDARPDVGGEDTCDGAWKMRGGRRRSLNTSQTSVITLLVISKSPATESELVAKR